MKSRWRAIIALALLPLCSAALAQDGSIQAVARNAWPNASADDIAGYLRAGVWNPNKTAVATCASAKCWVFLKRPDRSFLAVEITQVEDGNLGKIGRHAYERVETQPVRWLARKDDLFQIVMRTRAWASGQRYAAEEPLIIQPDGRVIYR